MIIYIYIYYQILDLELNLENNTYKPYTKENAEISYVSTESDHPESILKQIPYLFKQDYLHCPAVKKYLTR